MTVTEKQIYNFLKKVDNSFPVPISKKQNLSDYARKLLSQATICWKLEEGEIVSMVAGYTDNLTDDVAYIALVATVDVARGKGYAKKLVSDFINICERKGIRSAHLYTHATNKKAINMYISLGFEEYVLENEPRPDDVHLVYSKKG